MQIVWLESDGRREDANYHYCTLVKEAEERLRQMGWPGSDSFETGDLLETGRRQPDYPAMRTAYIHCLDCYGEELRKLAEGDQAEARKARRYIEEHYQEELNLEILAKVVHMNPYYFSRFFKQHTGEGFKDYLNKVRLEHALPLLVSTGLGSGEIAARTGFRNVRSFNESFLKAYGETPASYRRRIRGGR